MIEQKIQIPTASGTAEGILFRPKQEGRRPGVIQYTDIGGIRVSQQEMARRLAGPVTWCSCRMCSIALEGCRYSISR